MKRSVDELCDFLLDAQEEYRTKMREADRLIEDARGKFLDAVIEAEKEVAGEQKHASGWTSLDGPTIDLDVGRCEFEWTDGGDLSVQLREALATGTPKSCRTCLHQCMDMSMDPYCAAVNKPWGQVLTRRPKECAGESGENYKLWEKDTR